jgi:hypothetical protein
MSDEEYWRGCSAHGRTYTTGCDQCDEFAKALEVYYERKATIEDVFEREREVTGKSGPA